MSFILDALKKSELDRQRQTEPGLIDSGRARARSHLPIWGIALGCLLGINLLVLLFMMVRHEKPPAPAQGVVAARPAAELSAAAGHPPKDYDPPDRAQTTAPVYAPEIPLSAAFDETPKKPPAAVHRGPPAADRPPATDSASDAERDEILPSIGELNLSGAQALPELHLDVHVFATQSADRFVYVNMRKYKEGAVLQEGPKVERIRRDGVVLSYGGVRFLLPRQ
jgi:general secretion pathway protein B